MITNVYNKNISYCAIFGGHGVYGHLASEIAKNEMHRYLEEKIDKLMEISQIEEMSTFMNTMFESIQEKLKNSKGFEFLLCGTCLLIVLIITDQIWIINLGDCDGFLSKLNNNDKTIFPILFNLAHTTERKDEIERIKQLGGKIERSKIDDKEIGPLKVWRTDEDIPGVTFTRSLGDILGHECGILSMPEISRNRKSQEDKFLIICSKGIWESLNSIEICKIVSNCKKEDESATKLFNECNESLQRIKKAKIESYIKEINLIEQDLDQREKKIARFKQSQIFDYNLTAIIIFF